MVRRAQVDSLGVFCPECGCRSIVEDRMFEGGVYVSQGHQLGWAGKMTYRLECEGCGWVIQQSVSGGPFS